MDERIMTGLFAHTTTSGPAQSLAHALCRGPEGMISLIGGGGKTTLMFRLAGELARTGRKVLTTTTTKIFRPDHAQSPEVVTAPSAESLAAHVKDGLLRHSHLTAGSTLDPETGKLVGLDPTLLDHLWALGLADWMIVEADGSRQKPLKASDTHEPVIPGATTELILLAGLDALGRPLDEDHIHRPLIFSHNTGLALGCPVDEAAMALCIALELQKASGFCRAREHLVFLNKADTTDRIEAGVRISGLLKSYRLPERVIIAALQQAACIRQDITLHAVRKSS